MSSPGPGGDHPKNEDLDALLGEIGETLGEPEELPPLTEPSRPWPGWLVWAAAGALCCALAGALAAGNSWTGLGSVLYTYHGLPGWAWGAIDGALVGAQSAWAYLAWTRVREGRWAPVKALGLLFLGSVVAVTLAFLGVGVVAALVRDSRSSLPNLVWIPRYLVLNGSYGCALCAALLAHVSLRHVAAQAFMSWTLCALLFLPLALLRNAIDMPVGEEFFWRTGFPHYLALPCAWWLAAKRTPLPAAPEESSSDES